jgi:hypothetical protein
MKRTGFFWMSALLVLTTACATPTAVPPTATELPASATPTRHPTETPTPSSTPEPSPTAVPAPTYTIPPEAEGFEIFTDNPLPENVANGLKTRIVYEQELVNGLDNIRSGEALFACRRDNPLGDFTGNGQEDAGIVVGPVSLFNSSQITGKQDIFKGACERTLGKEWHRVGKGDLNYKK